MTVTIRPGTARGTVAAPPSKSMAHRLLLCAGLARGTSVVQNVAPSQDILATLDCLEALGARYTFENGVVTIAGTDPVRAAEGTLLPCRESGSTLRFFLPLCLLSDRERTLSGSGKLLSRPLGVYEDLCRARGLGYARTEDSVTVRGPLQAGRYAIPGGISSQFVSGLLFALPLLPGSSALELVPPVESRSYIDMTLQALGAYGVSAAWAGEHALSIPGGQQYQSRTLRVEGDYSNGAFLEALNLAGGDVTVTGLDPDSLQGDRVYGDYFAQLQKGPATLDLTDCPDLGPVLFAAAALLHGGVFTGTRRLKLKESDRGAAMAQELAKFGIVLDQEADRITVRPGTLRPPAVPLDGHNDHRIVMALTLLATRTGGTILGAQAVNKSYPDFFETLSRLELEVEEHAMDQ